MPKATTTKVEASQRSNSWFMDICIENKSYKDINMTKCPTVMGETTT